MNYGEALAGFIGAEDHLNYTVIGDSVNIAQRIQSIAGPNEILISKDLFNAVGDGFSDLEDIKKIESLPPMKLRGKEKEIYLYKVTYDLEPLGSSVGL